MCLSNGDEKSTDHLHFKEVVDDIEDNHLSVQMRMLELFCMLKTLIKSYSSFSLGFVLDELHCSL